MRSTLLIPALAGLAAAHFEMLYPDSIGFADDNEDSGPCGGFTPDLDGDDLVDFHVGGDALAMRSTHPRSNWLFRVTTQGDAQSGWEQLRPIVTQSGLGEYCEPHVTVPEKYIGKKGVIGVVSSAMDGLLYQCVAANFVKGTADQPDDCRNGTARIFYSEDDDLSALVDGGDDDSSATPTTGAADEPTETPDAGASLRPWTTSGFGMGSGVVVLAAAFAGGMFAL